jgi:hypothetical protein
MHYDGNPPALPVPAPAERKDLTPQYKIVLQKETKETAPKHSWLNESCDDCVLFRRRMNRLPG